MTVTSNCLLAWISKMRVIGVKLIRMNCIWNNSQRVTVWSGISAFRINGPYFFEDETGSAVTVTSNRCMHMVNEFLFPQCCRHDIDFATTWFQQAGATAPTARQSMNTLRTVFERHLISRTATFLGQPVHPICRLAIAVVCLEHVRQTYITTNREFLMKSLFPPTMLLRVMENVLNRVLQCISL